MVDFFYVIKRIKQFNFTVFKYFYLINKLVLKYIFKIKQKGDNLYQPEVNSIDTTESTLIYTSRYLNTWL